MRLFKECGKFRCVYIEEFTTEMFTITQVLTNLPEAQYQIKEIVNYDPPDFY